MAEETISSSDHVDCESSVAYFVPLSPFERRLLSDLPVLLDQQQFIPFDPQNAAITAVFNEWHWSSLVKRCLDDDLGEEHLLEDYQGDRSIAYNAFIHFLAHQGEAKQSLARVEGFRSANEDFLLKLGDRSIKNVEVKPVEKDLHLWETLSRLYQTYGWCWKHKEPLSNPEGTFDIWKLIRKFTLQWQWPENKDDVNRVLIMNPSFAAFYEVKRHCSTQDGSQIQVSIGEFEQLDIKQRPSAYSIGEYPEGEPKVDEDGSMTDAYLKFLLRGLGHSRLLEDPRAYLHLVPWKDLTCENPKFLRQSGLDLNVPFFESDIVNEWVLWTPPYPGFVWNHHLHTEDEVYEYNIMNDWSFPDHYLKHQVVFAVRKVDETDLVSELREYWDTWNDCALTQKTADGPLLLLETIPGLRFRSRKKYQDNVAALTYFRNLVEAHATDTLDVSSVRNIIGLEPGYTPLFEHSLRVIPEEQLFNISWDEPLGEGENGAVYRAMWRKPAGHLATTRTGDQELHVVLKDVLSRRGTSQDPLKKLLKELDVTYASLGGRAVGCVEFLGIALVHYRLKKAGDGDRKLFLVFERATQATVLGFLSRQLKDLTFVSCWDQVASAISSIANGITSLHEHGVLHRDLHMNNILVTDRYYPNDPQHPHEYSCMITDFGEGKVLKPGQEKRDPTDHHASYGVLEFRAPEVHGNQGWSTKAEAFSFGVIACKIMECRRRVCTTPPPEWVLSEVEVKHHDLRQNVDMIAHIVPARLKSTIEPCLSYSPDDRPSMREVVDALDDLTIDFTADSEGKRKVKWVCWRWDESLDACELRKLVGTLLATTEW
ncbi:Protein kinase-like domain containing protein [Elaphomyces granulatus]